MWVSISDDFLESSRLDLRDIKDIIHELDQGIRTFVDFLHVVFFFFRHISEHSLQKKISISLNNRHRRAELVRCNRKKIILIFIDFLQARVCDRKIVILLGDRSRLSLDFDLKRTIKVENLECEGDFRKNPKNDFYLFRRQKSL